jgi:hypothetical protein
MKVTINNKKYNASEFIESVSDKYCNLEIYPLVGTLEIEAGILSDLAKCLPSEVSYRLYGNPELGSNQFIENNIQNFSENAKNTITRVCPGYLNPDLLNSIAVLCNENSIDTTGFNFVVKFKDIEKVLYLTDDIFRIFRLGFKSYNLKNGICEYSNLICLCMIVKDAGPLFEKVLTDNLSIIDQWCILDTGSTDGTQDVIRRVLKNKKGNLYEEPFVDFMVSRNRCLELAGNVCKFIIMLDDTYSVRGDLRTFLTEVRGDQFSDSFSLLIQSDDSEYYSNRIIKSSSNLKYIHRIHEVITDINNHNVTIPPDCAFIFDNRSDYMEQRTTSRKQFDLDLLFKELEEFPDDPRALYYIAQTYGCLGDETNKAKYFRKRINHPVQGYVQEKIDSYFELARTMNFKLNGDWKECEKLYLAAWNLDHKRPDSLYFIGIKYYLDKDYSTSYKYFKSAFEIGYPIDSQYSLKPTLSFHFLPKFLTEVCYYLGDFATGEAAANLFLTSNRYNKPGGDSWDLMISWLNIHHNLKKLPSISETPIIRERKLFCIVADGGWGNWSGKDILTKGVGGSETWVIEMARHVKKNSDFDVVVFCKTDESEFFEGVGYNPLGLFHQFVADYLVEYCIISRYTEYVPVALQSNCVNVGLIFHDLLTPDTIIPIHPKLKWIFGLTEWHCDHIAKIFPHFSNIITPLNYGIDQSLFESTEGQKIKNSFIYSSFPNRGLVVLLRMWSRITSAFPDSVLNVYCNLDGDWVNRVIPEEMVEIKSLIDQPGINYHSWVSKSELADAWKSAEYWLYPCTFKETFCLTALEAAISKTFVISNGLAALGETIGDRGLNIPGNPLTSEWQTECLKKLFCVMDCTFLQDTISNYQWAKSLSWESQAGKLLDILKPTLKVLLFITGHAQLEEYNYFSTFLKNTKLKCDIYIYCNNPNISPDIVKYYQKFDQKNKYLFITSSNGGYRTGSVEAVSNAIEMGIFKNYDYVIHLHPDVFITKSDYLIQVLTENIDNDTVFFINKSLPCDPMFFSFDFFIFKPKLLKINIFNELFTESPEHFLYNSIKKHNIKYTIIRRYDNDTWYPRRIDDHLKLYHEHDLEKVKKLLQIMELSNLNFQ